MTPSFWSMRPLTGERTTLRRAPFQRGCIIIVIWPVTAEFAAVQCWRIAIKTVVLQSSGGSVSDALAMGRLIRAKKFLDGSRDRALLRIRLPARVRWRR